MGRTPNRVNRRYSLEGEAAEKSFRSALGSGATHSVALATEAATRYTRRVTEPPGNTGPNDSGSANDKPGHHWMIWATIALLLLYPLSIGPVVILFPNNTPDAVVAFYTPLRALYTRSAIAHKVIDWYLHLWGF